MELKITAENFKDLVLDAKTPVVLDFWAVWCGPCRMLSPIISELAEEYAGKIAVGKVNVDEEGELARQFGVMSIPLVVLMKDGKIAATSLGYKPKAQLKSELGLD